MYVPSVLKTRNESAYEPKFVSIGYRYHDKAYLRENERFKKSQFTDHIEKDPETEKNCNKAVAGMEQKARKWYGLKKKDDKYELEKFKKTMLRDGCFVVLLFLGKLRRIDHQKTHALLGDLLLFENQLPLFLLDKLYGLIKNPEDDEEDFAKLACAKLNEVLLELREGTAPEIPFNIKDTNEKYTLLGLVHDNWVQGILDQSNISYQDQTTGKGGVKVISCATELKEAGITFEKNMAAASLFEVEYKDGKMKIPTLVLDSMTERLFYNFIAYEVRVKSSTSFVTDYARLMYNLVNTEDDVKLLRSKGVIKNMLPDDESAAKLLKKLIKNVTLSDRMFLYRGIFEEVQKYCATPSNTWKAKLRRDYFSNPWSGIAFVAALVVFLITIATFVFSFLKN